MSLKREFLGDRIKSKTKNSIVVIHNDKCFVGNIDNRHRHSGSPEIQGVSKKRGICVKGVIFGG